MGRGPAIGRPDGRDDGPAIGSGGRLRSDRTATRSPIVRPARGTRKRLHHHLARTYLKVGAYRNLKLLPTTVNGNLQNSSRFDSSHLLDQDRAVDRPVPVARGYVP